MARLDGVAAELHPEVIQSAARNDANDPLSPLSYLRILRDEFGEETTLDYAVDHCRMLIARRGCLSRSAGGGAPRQGWSMAQLMERITVNPRQCGGRPCVRGMRIRVSDVLQLLASGMTPKQIVR